MISAAKPIVALTAAAVEPARPAPVAPAEEPGAAGRAPPLPPDPMPLVDRLEAEGVLGRADALAVGLRADADADRPLGTSEGAGELANGSACHLVQRPKLEVTQCFAMQLQPLELFFHDFPFRSSIVASCFPSP